MECNVITVEDDDMRALTIYIKIVYMNKIRKGMLTIISTPLCKDWIYESLRESSSNEIFHNSFALPLSVSSKIKEPFV